MTPLGLGNDKGGSLRIPAQCCGIDALKPTSGRVPHAASIEPRDYGLAAQIMLVHGPLARSVADLRLCLSILAGRDVRDPRSVDAPLLEPKPDERRVALVTRLPGEPLEESSISAIQRAGDLLRAAGWEVEEAEPPELARVGDVFGAVLAADLSAIAAQSKPFISEALFEHLLRLCEKNRLADLSTYRVFAERSRLTRVWSAFLSDYSVAIGPNWGRPFWATDADLDPASGVELLENTIRFIAPGNVLGLPSVAVPTGMAGGLPVGIQIYADLWREDLCLRAAEIVEAGFGGASPIDPARV
jgi:amidase